MTVNVMRGVLWLSVFGLLLLSVFFIRRAVNSAGYYKRNDFRSTTAEVVKIDTCHTGSSPLRFWPCAQLQFSLPSGKIARFHDEALRRAQAGEIYEILYKSEDEVAQERYGSGYAENQTDPIPSHYFDSWEARRADLFGLAQPTANSIAKGMGSLLLAALIAHQLQVSSLRRGRP